MKHTIFFFAILTVAYQVYLFAIGLQSNFISANQRHAIIDAKYQKYQKNEKDTQSDPADLTRLSVITNTKDNIQVLVIFKYADPIKLTKKDEIVENLRNSINNIVLATATIRNPNKTPSITIMDMLMRSPTLSETFQDLNLTVVIIELL